MNFLIISLYAILSILTFTIKRYAYFCHFQRNLLSFNVHYTSSSLFSFLLTTPIYKSHKKFLPQKILEQEALLVTEKDKKCYKETICMMTTKENLINPKSRHLYSPRRPQLHQHSQQHCSSALTSNYLCYIYYWKMKWGQKIYVETQYSLQGYWTEQLVKFVLGNFWGRNLSLNL